METIVFDLDDTLYNLMGPFEQAHDELFANRTNVDCETLFRRSRVHSDTAFYLADEGKITQEEAFAYRIQTTYQEQGVELTKEEVRCFEERYRYYQRHIELPEGSIKILDYLKEKKIKCGILTNGLIINQQKKIDSLQLERWINPKYLFISEAVGAVKPEKAVFDTVKEQLGAKLDQAWYIGDAFDMDIVGAKKAGWHAIWFNHRHRKMPEVENTPDIEVDAYEDLYKAIKKIVES